VKHIIKGDEPKTFSDWKAKANEDWQPSYAVLSGDVSVFFKRDSNGMFGEFYSTIHYLFGDYISA